MKQSVIMGLIALTSIGLVSCGSDNGNDGSNGDNALVNTTELTLGNANCYFGGVQIDTGVDSNNNSTLDTSEISSTDYVC